MVKEIIHNPLFLSQKSKDAGTMDIGTIKDLKDTLFEHKEECVGMAANMIGVLKNIIVVDAGFGAIVMVNPVISKKSNSYETTEKCLSIEGERKTKRYDVIEVNYLDENFKKKTNEYKGWIAQIIQHEIDHLNGILI